MLQRVDTLGIDRSRMHILEALLRLRQAACHPALADAILAGDKGGLSRIGREELELLLG